MKEKINTINNFLKKEFGEKIYKLSLDGGFSCPNRDGKLSYGGCIFCSESGSGEFAATKIKTISEQIDEQIKSISKKFNGKKYIAYFQNFTNTYAPVEYLKRIYEEALKHPNIIGLAIATRPDCIDDEILNLLVSFNKKTFLWIELGLQTINDDVANFFNRGYKTAIYENITKKLNERKIKFVTHIILGLPYEKKEDSLNTALFAEKCGTWGLKLHLMYVVKGTKLETLYKNSELKIYKKEDYVKKIISILENISYNIIIHRITGDGDKKTLVAPLWSLNKKDVLNSIQKKLKESKTFQGKNREDIL
ncbi:MAG: TIGR01212 family radical SAM protein [Fusobacterium sp.]|uniref:TIGR01212 family radical SAM protein n=1 Tax=Fusobacterium sp. TaxID=68766 RepID=UPI0026DD2398|nr:TIGR01212 family radical SAM protein [Fusobacterium sp.]MDO4690828.1 TIGR01212 family radical SAM protein [Fusobacterium sp.]